MVKTISRSYHWWMGKMVGRSHWPFITQFSTALDICTKYWNMKIFFTLAFNRKKSEKKMIMNINIDDNKIQDILFHSLVWCKQINPVLPWSLVCNHLVQIVVESHSRHIVVTMGCYFVTCNTTLQWRPLGRFPCQTKSHIAYVILNFLS